MEPQSPRPATTVRRNPSRKAKQTSSTHGPCISNSSKIGAGAGINPFSLDEALVEEPSRIAPISSQNPRRSIGNPSNNLKVFLRIRPLDCRTAKGSKIAGGDTRPPARGKLAKELARNTSVCLFVNSSTSVTLNAPPSAPDSKRAKSEVYDGFSHVFPPESLQEDIYDKLMQPLITSFMEGQSLLLVAMGPTGSGKSYTMFGSPQQLGIVPLALSQIFSQKTEIENTRASRTYYLSIFEIYSERGKSEKIFDLSPQSIDTTHPQSSISKVKEVKVTTLSDANNIISYGIIKRSTTPTNANNQSSRSQCIVNVRCVVNNGADKYSISSAVLTIADLAGAERERKTGNQGARLLESNFINNTSMVFGLCLRSLLEHQKNPKKPIEKHFKNSLLTRYLQDYMEGKKQMTLILTVKAAEEDYMDTSFILRQASPYMKIKFNHLQENKNAPCQKRNAAVIKTEKPKRRKVDISEASLAYANIVVDGVSTSQISGRDSAEKESINMQINAEVLVELKKIKRSEEVMRNFASAFWSMLKQYKHQLKLAENEVQYLKDSLRERSAQATVLEKELKELRCSCSCLHNPPVEECAELLPYNHVLSVPSVPSDLEHLHIADAPPNECHTLMYIVENPEIRHEDAKSDMLVKGMDDVVIDLPNIARFTPSLEDEDCIPLLPGNEEASFMQVEKDQLEVKVAASPKDQEIIKSNATQVLASENDDPALRPLNSKKPKRKLLPASEMLLNSFDGLDMDENVKEIRRKRAKTVKERSEGSISLIRILKSNLLR